MSAIGATIDAMAQAWRADRYLPRWTVSAADYAAIQAELTGHGFPLIVAFCDGLAIWPDDHGAPPNIVLRNVPVFSMESLAS